MRLGEKAIFKGDKKNQRFCDRCQEDLKVNEKGKVCFVYKNEYLFCNMCDKEVQEKTFEFVQHYCPQEAWEQLCHPCRIVMRDHLEMRRKWFTENKA